MGATSYMRSKIQRTERISGRSSSMETTNPSRSCKHPSTRPNPSSRPTASGSPTSRMSRVQIKSTCNRSRHPAVNGRSPLVVALRPLAGRQQRALLLQLWSALGSRYSSRGRTSRRRCAKGDVSNHFRQRTLILLRCDTRWPARSRNPAAGYPQQPANQPAHGGHELAGRFEALS
jgi:hypothetical protein